MTSRPPITSRRSWSRPACGEPEVEAQAGSMREIVARRRDINANQLFKWRRELALPTSAEARLVPVAVLPETVTGPMLQPGAVGRATPLPARIEIAVAGGGRVRVAELVVSEIRLVD